MVSLSGSDVLFRARRRAGWEGGCRGKESPEVPLRTDEFQDIFAERRDVNIAAV